ncbi:hypothetical protein GGX14DRAFT_387270 [Mycena pura]|uniref:Uncharacterized protein n=1 Tax=Mycena pura TaxID=153505 RepID=A0AAD6YNJ0_9AGAR|nr:hypothetical protein GGX14DRAFT_387270 [Mycena pura]
MSPNARSIERAHLKRARVLEVARAVQGGAVGRRRAAVAAGIEKTRAEALVHGVENEPARTLNGACARRWWPWRAAARARALDTQSHGDVPRTSSASWRRCTPPPVLPALALHCPPYPRAPQARTHVLSVEVAENARKNEPATWQSGACDECEEVAELT